MRRTRLILVVLCCHFVLVGAFAQKNKKQKDSPGNDLEKRAAELFGQGDYVAAYPLYSQLLSLEEKSTDYNFRFGVCELFAGKDKEKAIAYLKFASAQTNAPDEVFFYLGRAYHLNYRFSDALAMYYRYKEKAGSSASRKLDVERHMEMCHNGRNLLREIRDLVVMDRKEVREEDFFRSFDIDGNFGGRILPKPDEFKSRNDLNRSDRSVMFMSSDRNEVYFAGYGETSDNTDIFRVTRTVTGEWGNPENLGSIINTPYDEAFPCLHPDGRTLYFASKGHNSMGGYDLFKSVYDEERRMWSPPKNLDFAINSPADDMLYMPDDRDSIAFFASNRASVGGMVSVYKIRADRMPVSYSAARRRDITSGTGDTLALDTDILRQKALLDVNATPDVLAQLDEGRTQNNAGDSDTTAVSPGEGGTEELPEEFVNLSEEDILNMAYGDADRLMNEAREARRQANSAALLAEQKRTESLTQEEQAEAVLKTSERTGDEELKKEKQNDGEALMTAAEYNKKQAAVALRMSQKLDTEADALQREADQALENARTIEQALKSNSTAEAIEILALQKERLEAAGARSDASGAKGEAPADATQRQTDEYRRLTAVKQEELEKTAAYADALEKDAYDYEKDAIILREEADKTSDSQLKGELLTQAAELEESAGRKRVEAEQSRQKAEELGSEVQAMHEEAEMAGKIAGEIRVLEQTGAREKEPEALVMDNPRAEESPVPAETEDTSPADEVGDLPGEPVVLEEEPVVRDEEPVAPEEEPVTEQETDEVQPMQDEVAAEKEPDVPPAYSAAERETHIADEERKAGTLTNEAESLKDEADIVRSTADEMPAGANRDALLAKAAGLEASATLKQAEAAKASEQAAGLRRNVPAATEVPPTVAEEEPVTDARTREEVAATKVAAEPSEKAYAAVPREELLAGAEKMQTEAAASEQRREELGAANQQMAVLLNEDFELLARSKSKDKEHEILERMDAIKRRQEANQKQMKYERLRTDLLREEANARLEAAGQEAAYEGSTSGRGSAEERSARLDMVNDAIETLDSAATLRAEAEDVSQRAAAARSQQEKETLYSESIALENEATEKEARADGIFAAVFESRLSGEPLVIASSEKTTTPQGAAEGPPRTAEKASSEPVTEQDLGLRYDNTALKTVISDAEYANYNSFVTSAVKKKEDSRRESDNAERLRSRSAEIKKQAVAAESRAASLAEGEEKQAEMAKARALRQESEELDRQSRAALALANQHDEEANDNLFAAESYIGRLDEEKYGGTIPEGKAAEPVASSRPPVQPAAATPPAEQSSEKPVSATPPEEKPEEVTEVSPPRETAATTPARTAGAPDDTPPATAFSIAPANVYSAAKPIPVDKPLPEGLVFKVQVGAFRNPIPQDLFRGISPVAGESAGGGLIRYTAGMFRGFDPADNAKNMIRAMGYRDAFVVAFYNGGRISVADARAMLEKEGRTGEEDYRAGVKKELEELAKVKVPEVTALPPQRPAPPAAAPQEAPVEGDLGAMQGLVYTVQVGVYSRAVTAAELFNIRPLYSEKLPNGTIRYTTGIHKTFEEAQQSKVRVVGLGVRDAFVVAYRDGKRVPLSEARGEEVRPAPRTDAPRVTRTPDSAEVSVSEFELINPLETGVKFRVQIGAFRSKVPSEVVNFWIERLKQKITSYRTESGITLFTVGELVNYEAAKALRDDLEKQGMGDVFVTAYENGKPVSIQRAIELTAE